MLFHILRIFTMFPTSFFLIVVVNGDDGSYEGREQTKFFTYYIGLNFREIF